MTTAGVWAYTLNNANSAVQALNVGDTLTDTFTVTTVDGTPKVVTVTIHGANDAAIISGTTTGSVIETGGVVNATPGTPTATGTLTDTDVDNPANTFTAVSSPTASAGGYGTFTMTAAGVWTYTLDDSQQRGAGAQCRRHADRHLHGDHHRRHATGGDDHHPRPVDWGDGDGSVAGAERTHLTATALDDNIAGSAPNATLTTTSGNFSTAFTSVQGVDGATISYALIDRRRQR